MDSLTLFLFDHPNAVVAMMAAGAAGFIAALWIWSGIYTRAVERQRREDAQRRFVHEGLRKP